MQKFNDDTSQSVTEIFTFDHRYDRKRRTDIPTGKQPLAGNLCVGRYIYLNSALISVIKRSKLCQENNVIASSFELPHLPYILKMFFCRLTAAMVIHQQHI